MSWDHRKKIGTNLASKKDLQEKLAFEMCALERVAFMRG